MANPSDLIERMSFTWRRASKALVVTTATTFFAFIGTAFSSIMPIAAFGIFACLVVAMNYVLTITLYPAFLSYWYQNVKHKEKCCNCWNNMCNKCSKTKPQSKTPNTPDNNNGTATLMDSNNYSTFSDTELETQSDIPVQHEPRYMEVFLRDKWSSFVFRIKYGVIVIVIVLFSLSLWQAVQIGPLTSQEKFFPEDHYLECLVNIYPYQHIFILKGFPCIL